jgi:SAM-dependent methyltransferase
MRDVEMRCVCGASRTQSGDRFVRIRASNSQSYSYAECGFCGHLTMCPMPSADEITSFYDATYYGLGERKFPLVLDAVRGLLLAQRTRVSTTEMTAPADVLDVGCGDGRYLKAMRNLGHRIHGIEIQGPAYDRASRIDGIRLRAPPLNEGTFPLTRFQLVTAWHVLEHVPDPMTLLESIGRVLAPDGRLVVEVPNTWSWHGRLTGTNSFNLDPPRHLHQFTQRSLTLLLGRAGYDVERVQTRSFEMGVMGVVQSILNCVLKPRDLFYDLLRSRGMCPGHPAAKVVAICLAIPLIPCAIVWTAAETVAGHGPVLRVICRRRPVQTTVAGHSCQSTSNFEQ